MTNLSKTRSIINGENPLMLSLTDPIALFLIQMCFIVILSRIIHLVLRYLNQPRVVSEIIGGILLGPTALGRISSFSNSVFPKPSITYLNLVANLGLLLFLFIIGLELEISTLKTQIKKSALISICGMIVPFAVGSLISFALFKTFQNSGRFYVFLLFCGVSISITAFPVLARILSELGLLKTNVGFATITAASVDDVTAWIFLALVISLAKSSNALSALWILLTGVAYVLFVSFVVQRLYMKYLRKEGFLDGRDPSTQIVFITLTMAFISGWFTDVLGIHAIFGAYIIGVIVPHNEGFAIKIAEKIEDLISIFFLPIYFGLSGLNTNLGLLNSGKAWLLLILTVSASFFGKIAGCSLAARFSKYSWRESLTIGVLMSCKGLVELIVLNIGLQNNIINQEVFSILVLSALVTTFATTPIVKLIYPKSRYRYIKDESSDINTVNGFVQHPSRDVTQPLDLTFGTLVVVEKLQQIPYITTLMGLFGNSWEGSEKLKSVSVNPSFINLEFFFLRLVRMTSRQTSMMLNYQSKNLEIYDPVLNTIRAFSQTSKIKSTFQLDVCDKSEVSENIIEYSRNANRNLIIIPALDRVNGHINPKNELYLDFSQGLNGIPHSRKFELEMMRKIYKNSKCDVGVFVNRGLIPPSAISEKLNMPMRAINADNELLFDKNDQGMTDDKNQSDTPKGSDLDTIFEFGAEQDLPIIFIPFFGGIDDKSTIKTAVKLFSNPKVRILIIYYMFHKDFIDSSNNLKNEHFYEPTPVNLKGHKESIEGTPNSILELPSIFKSKFRSLNPSVSKSLTPAYESSSVEERRTFFEKKLEPKEDIIFLDEYLGIKLSEHVGSVLNKSTPSTLSVLDQKKEVLQDDEKFDDLDFDNCLSSGKNFEKNSGFDTVGSSKNDPKNIKMSEPAASQYNINFTAPVSLSSKKSFDISNNILKKSQGGFKRANIEILDNTSSEARYCFKEKSNFKDVPPKNFENLGDGTILCQKSPKYPNITFCAVKTNKPLRSSLSHSMVLRHCDLIICGRNEGHRPEKKARSVRGDSIGIIGSGEIENYPNHDLELQNDSLLMSFRVKMDERNAIGIFGERLLRMKCRASNLIIQSNDSVEGSYFTTKENTNNTISDV
ncbi:K(+)/H(+) antiporter 1 [Smittium mucronatum]|uniref:K(+)/H(+) antiporter 1 n=1 Tax=Smittium mucronatum TaxID=133383 RepID=A0A1R0H7P2_9FUNG|nr:K(+)/H(+) antiporter 1 [Smittium mucronatum]